VTLTDKIVDSPEGLFPGGWWNDSSVPVGASKIFGRSLLACGKVSYRYLQLMKV
jgi:hypothetical protein